MYVGIDTLESTKFKPLIGARIGLCTNNACCDSRLKPTIALFAEQKCVNLTVVFAPEHGLYGALQDQVKTGDSYDNKNKITISSLYGRTFAPDRKILEKIDILVIDLQDIGTRYYTFLWSALLMIKWTTSLKKKVFVLDRPNPLDGKRVQGPVLEPAYSSFVGLYPIPIRHGMTIGELCTMINSEFSLGADIQIVKMKGWLRNYYFDDTGLRWTVPSPNMPSFDTALVYPGMCLLEGTNISEGRGTTRPFEIFGAPWIDAFEFVKAIKNKTRGVDFRPLYFIPTFSKYKGKPCGGAQIYVTNRNTFDPAATGLEIIRTIRALYPSKFRWRRPPYEFEKHKLPIDILLGNSWIRKALENNKSIASIKGKWQRNLDRFKKMRKRYLLYT